MACVTLHVYDVANTENENLNGFLKVRAFNVKLPLWHAVAAHKLRALQVVNNVAREIRAGGIYHGMAYVDVYLL